MDSLVDEECCYRNIITPLMTFDEAVDACYNVLGGSRLVTVLDNATNEVGEDERVREGGVGWCGGVRGT